MKKYLLLVLFALTLVTSGPLTAQISIQTTSKNSLHNKSIKPNIQHGINYQKVSNIEHYFVSEKLDGVRGYWDGEKLMTRQGNLINSPSWFTLNWPKYPMDGELWIERGQFQALMSCVSRKEAEQNKAISCWKKVRFMMFDLPAFGGDFSHRVKQMSTLSLKISSPYLAMINQVKYTNINELDKKLDEVIAADGEGLMLHKENSFYKEGRNTALMKLKKHQDAEATIIAHTKGKGKYQDQLGAIQVKTADGIIFKIGSGFSDNLRANPPEIGSIITFKYNGLTQAGVPRFARFWRIKEAE